MASTTTTLSSSLPTSAMNAPICFMSRSTLASEPVLSSVVMASVAMERLASPMSASRSSLHLATTGACAAASLCSVRTAAKRSAGLGDARNMCSMVMAGPRSRDETLGRLQTARAASKITISLLWRMQPSRKSVSALACAGESAAAPPSSDCV